MRREASRWIRAAVAALLLAGAAHAQTEAERTGGPYVPTPQLVVDQMLRLANVGADDYLMDLGSGDGVIVLTAVTWRALRSIRDRAIAPPMVPT